MSFVMLHAAHVWRISKSVNLYTRVSNSVVHSHADWTVIYCVKYSGVQFSEQVPPEYLSTHELRKF